MTSSSTDGLAAEIGRAGKTVPERVRPTVILSDRRGEVVYRKGQAGRMPGARRSAGRTAMTEQATVLNRKRATALRIVLIRNGEFVVGRRTC
jgi:hypothetical protein